MEALFRLTISCIGFGCLFITSCATGSNNDPISQTPKGSEQVQSFDLDQSIKLELVFIKGGSYLMGSPEIEQGRTREDLSVRQVEVGDFWIGRFEVTDEQYLAIMKQNIRFDRRLLRPKQKVKWNEALEFCKRLSERTGWTFNLPTEAQWEYACRAGTQTLYCFGDDERELGDYAWYDGNASKWSEIGHPQNVGLKKPNNWGIYDMHGNVWEWCLDRYTDDLIQERDKKPEDKEYFEKAGLIPRVIRGGDWHSGAMACRSSSRIFQYERELDFKIGFRVVAMPPAQ